ncbi:MFS transporter [Terrabacter carboxydivorans]|uniref:MFS transporter n=1 Tax=Terrabacter carboxydivorans TaxID=619730 RepID=A0ABP5ZXT2_9MICO
MRGGGQWRWPALTMFTVGYGANQFVPLLAVYRRTLGLSDIQATAIFGVYALGLIPGLLLGGRASDRFGRRILMIGFAALSLLATAVLAGGQWGAGWLYAGRLLTGVVSGTVFTIGTAWVKELSDDAAPGTGARRAAIALTAGFGVGPLVAGTLAQWAPAPLLLPYLLHLLLTLVVLAVLPRAPETHPRKPGTRGPRAPLLPASTRTARFRGTTLPLAPWVFGSVTLAFTTIPAHGIGSVAGLQVAVPGLLAALALAVGYGAQSIGRRLYAATAGDGDGRRAAAVGLTVVVLGCLAAAYATARPGLVSAAPAAAMLGAGYGLCLSAGLREVEETAAPDQLGSTVAIFYSLAYAGLLVPYVLTFIAPHAGYPWALTTAAATAALCTVVVLASPRGSKPAVAPS